MIDIGLEAEALRRDIFDNCSERLMTTVEFAIEDALDSVAARAWDEGREASARTENPYR